MPLPRLPRSCVGPKRALDSLLMKDRPKAGDLSGSLLVAHPMMADPNFRRTILYLSHHSADEGALGFILNRPLGQNAADLDIGDTLDQIPHVPIYEGGPVHRNQVMRTNSASFSAMPGGRRTNSSRKSRSTRGWWSSRTRNCLAPMPTIAHGIASCAGWARSIACWPTPRTTPRKINPRTTRGSVQFSVIQFSAHPPAPTSNQATHPKLNH